MHEPDNRSAVYSPTRAVHGTDLPRVIPHNVLDLTDVFQGMQRNHSVIVISGDEEQSRVLSLLRHPHSVNWRIPT